MASSRESSPAVSVSGTASPTQLTPNSKVKALLASLDKDSDVESVSGSPRRRLATSLAKDISSKPASNHASNKDAAPSKADVDSEEEEEIVRPKGRMAARMQAIGSSSEGSGASHDENPRQRVRRMLKSKSKSPRPALDTQDGASDGSDIPVVSRKRKIRVPRQDTPLFSPEKTPASPGLFVSPSTRRSAPPASDDSDSNDLPKVKDLASTSRFQALVKAKREEREAKEAIAAKEKAANAELRRQQRELMAEEGVLDDDDEEVERRLTQRAPTRKASKRALEDMHRETQRLSRNQQLAHNATTKKKFPRSGLFAIFNYNTEKGQTEPENPASSSPARAASETIPEDTPPSSPPTDGEQGEKNVPTEPTVSVDPKEELPSFEESSRISSSPPRKLEKGKGRATKEVISEAVTKKAALPQRSIRVRPPKSADEMNFKMEDSDSDLEIVPTKKSALKKKLDLMFDRVPAKQGRESQSMHALRTLAHLTSPGKQSFGRNKKPSITTSELQVNLQQKARQQATKEREERLQALREKGVIIQTSEEREKEAAEVDDLLSRARQEGEEIMKREKAAAKKERKESGEADPLGESSDDEDWAETKPDAEEEEVASGSDSENDGDRSENDASGESEEEEEEEEGGDTMDVDEDEKSVSNPMFDEEAGESDEEEEEEGPELPLDTAEAEIDALEDDDEVMLPTTKHRKSRKSNVISDDEDDEDEVDVHQTPRVPQNISPALDVKSPIAPNSVLRSASKTFIPGLPVVGVAGLGLTQIFAGTMDESQSDVFDEGFPTSPAPTFQQENVRNDSMAFLKRLAPPELPPFVATLEEDTQESEMPIESQIPESQVAATMTQGINFDFEQSQFHGFDSLVESTQISQFPDLTQDVGFQHMTPIKGRFVDIPTSTVDTMVLEPTLVPETVAETPVVKKKGKLRRRAPIVNFSDDEDIETSKMDIDEEDLDISTNVFDVMRKATKKKVVVEGFDKKKSDAKQMVHEQAEESEDEYAGLGGASDDESGGEADAFVKEMIDDEAGKDADERELAAFFADRERANDEKQVEKLYNDITKGMLRRKRGADYDLSDSDDGGEARQRRKRKEFAKMRKALLADERIGKIAENPKKLAFLRAIEDRNSEDEMDFLEEDPDEETNDSQSQQGGQEVVPNSQPTEMGPPKRKSPEDASSAEARAPPHLRRTNMGKKPSNLADIRQSLSSLIEEPNAVTATEDSESEDELEIVDEDDLNSAPAKAKEIRDPFALRKTNVAVIDRITLKRQSSSSVSSSSRLAFSASTAATGFKVPALLRRATTNSSITSTTSNSGASTTECMAGGSGGEGVKRGGGKNSGVNYFARESERRAAVVKTEKRREKKLVKGAQIRRDVVGGMLGGGKFE